MGVGHDGHGVMGLRHALGVIRLRCPCMEESLSRSSPGCSERIWGGPAGNVGTSEPCLAGPARLQNARSIGITQGLSFQVGCPGGSGDRTRHTQDGASGDVGGSTWAARISLIPRSTSARW